MSDREIPPVQGVSQEAAARRAVAQQILAQKLRQYSIMQEVAKEDFQTWTDLDAWNPLAMTRNFRTLERRLRERARSEEASKAEQEEETDVKIVEKLQEIAEQFHHKNPELQARTLLSLRARINRGDSPEEILRKLKQVYADVALVDEALDFLLETADADMRPTLEAAKQELNRTSEREVRAGRNIGMQARQFSQQGLGSPTALRDLYRHVSVSSHDAAALFQELATNYPIDKMRVVIDFILHSLGADIKSKGPSISRQELHKMMTETRNMQAILGIYRYFISRMNLMTTAFARQGLAYPPQLTFDLLARTFVHFLREKYPNVDKALSLGQQLGILGQIGAQLIIYLQYRDATRYVAPRLFRDERHRHDVLMCFIETLEDLEEKLEEENEKKKKQ